MLKLQQSRILFATKTNRRSTVKIVADSSSERGKQVISSLKNYLDDRSKTILSRKEGQVEVIKNWIQEELDAGKKLLEELAQIVKPDEENKQQGIDQKSTDDSNDGSSIEADDDDDNAFRYQLVPIPVHVSAFSRYY